MKIDKLINDISPDQDFNKLIEQEEIQNYITQDLIFSDLLIIQKLIFLHVITDRIDIWNLIGLRYNTKQGLKEVTVDSILEFSKQFGPKIKEMVREKQIRKNFLRKISF